MQYQTIKKHKTSKKMSDKKAAKKANEMAKYLKDNYDCISKLDAFKFLRKTYSNESLRLMNDAYYLAYPLTE